MKFRVEVNESQDVIKNNSIEVNIHVDKLIDESIDLNGLNKDDVTSELVNVLNNIL